MGRHRKLSQDSVNALVDLYKMGATTRTISEKLGISKPAIYRYLASAGVQLQYRRGRPQEYNPAFLDELADHCDSWGYTSAAALYGLSISHCRRLRYQQRFPNYTKAHEFSEVDKQTIAKRKISNSREVIDGICTDFWTIPDEIAKVCKEVAGVAPSKTSSLHPEVLAAHQEERLSMAYAKERFASPPLTLLPFEAWRERVLAGESTAVETPA